MPVSWRNPTNEPPPKNENILIAWMPDGRIVTTGSWRYGSLGEPDQDELAWRSDCSGRYDGIYAWAPREEIE